MPQTISTGPLDPDHYRNQVDRAARVMALFVAQKRKKKEDELEARRARATQLAEAAQRGDIPPDSAHLEAALRSYMELDPQGAGDLRLMTEGQFNQREITGTFEREVTGAKGGWLSENIVAALNTRTPYERALIIKNMGLTPEALTPKKEEIREPKTIEEALTGMVSGEYTPEMGQQFLNVLTDREGALNLLESRKRVYAKRAAAEQKKADAAAAMETFKQQRDYLVSHPMPSTARPRTPADVKPKEGADYIANRTIVRSTADYVKDLSVGIPERGPDAVPAARLHARGAMKAMIDAVALLDPETHPYADELAATMQANYDEAAEAKTEVDAVEFMRKQLRDADILR